MDGITDLMDMSLSKFREIVKFREAWHAAVHWVAKSWIQLKQLSTHSIYGYINVLIYHFFIFMQSAKTTPGADYGSDHELLIGKLRLKLKKVGKTTRPFRYYLNPVTIIQWK